MKRYVFYVITYGAERQELRWPGLTLKQAQCMYKWTTEHQPMDAMSFGWKEME